MRSETHLSVLFLALATVPEAQAPQQVQPAPQLGQTVGQAPTREAMWPAPTAEDWKRPCLLTWQRSFEDAVSVSQETGRAILICVNMDGEIASEHYAGIRYREPAIAGIYEPYVCVIASVYRHSPRDFDERGRRIECPRFGTVTCGEHIAIEPGLFGEYFEGQRVAPRHIMVELDRSETYDVYYAFDTESVFRTIREAVIDRPLPEPRIRGEWTLEERVTSRDVADREAVEGAYLEGDRGARRRLLRAAIEGKDADPSGLLRLAVFDLDLELNRLARQALAKANSEGSIDLIVEALRVPMDGAERDGLVAALERIGLASPRARTLASVHRGLAQGSAAMDVEGWAKALAEADTQVVPIELAVLESQLEYRAEASSLRPEDAGTFLELAQASIAFAVDPQSASVFAGARGGADRYAVLHFEDARRAGLQAEALGATGWRLDAVLGLSAWYLGDVSEAHERAGRAVAAMPSGVVEWNAMAVLELFADARQKAIAKAVREKREWPREWMADVHSAYSVLSEHPLGTAAQALRHHDFLRRFGASRQADAALARGLERFPDSWDLHARLRDGLLWRNGAAGLEAAYEQKLRELDASPNLEWYAGYASLVAAEVHRRHADGEAARLAYGRGIAHYERAIERNADARETCDHYIALALAGRARVALERGDLDTTVTELLASFERCAGAAASLDGLGISAVATADTALARLDDGQRGELAQQLQAALDALDPELLLPAEFDRVGTWWRRRAGRR